MAVVREVVIVLVTSVGSQTLSPFLHAVKENGEISQSKLKLKCNASLGWSTARWVQAELRNAGLACVLVKKEKVRGECRFVSNGYEFLNSGDDISIVRVVGDG